MIICPVPRTCGKLKPIRATSSPPREGGDQDEPEPLRQRLVNPCDGAAPMKTRPVRRIAPSKRKAMRPVDNPMASDMTTRIFVGNGAKSALNLS